MRISDWSSDVGASDLAGGGFVGPRANLNYEAQFWQPSPQANRKIRELSFTDDGFHIGIVEKIGQLVEAISVIDVDGHSTGLERGKISFEMLDRIKCVDRDLGVGPNPAVDQATSQGRRTLFDQAPITTRAAIDESRFAWDGIGDRKSTRLNSSH